MRCEICGREIRGTPYRAVIDGANLIVCKNCAQRYKSRIVGIYSQEVSMPSRRGRVPVRRYSARRTPLDIVEEVVEDYAERIREAREKMGLTRDVLAAMVGEKVSTIRRIEEGTLQPPLDLARKLEKILKIKLIEVYEEEGGGFGSPRSYDLTLGDIVEFKGGG